MTTFFVDSFGRDVPTTAETDPLDTLIGLSGGRPLPGGWGLLQAVVAAGATPRHNVPTWLHWPRVGLNVAGIVRAYRKSKDPRSSERRKDPVDAYLTAHGLRKVDTLSALTNMVLSYCAGLPHEDVLPGGTKDEWVRIFAASGDLRVAFRMWESGSYYGNREVGDGPYVWVGDHERFAAIFADLVWSREGGADLQLTARKSAYGGPATFTMSSIGLPGDYVDGDEKGAVVGVLKRCCAFSAVGMTRNVLFYGPPGTGKTTLARALARRLGNGRALRVEAEALETAGVLPTLQFVAVLRPRVLLFDDLDRCMGHVVELLHALEQGNAALGGVAIVGTINVIDAVDPALLRPGRFDEVVEIAEPAAEQRGRIVDHYLNKYGVDASVRDALAHRCDGFAPADIREVVQALSVTGIDEVDAEIARVTRQRRLYAGDACRRYSAAHATAPSTARGRSAGSGR